MQGLSYSLQEPNLKEMYLNLLATATDDRISDRAHPSFAEIVKQLSPAEAGMLAEVLKRESLPAVQLMRKAAEGSGGTYVANHLLPLTDPETGDPVEEHSLPVWVDNCVRLGLVEVSYMRSFVADERYEWVEDRPELLRLSQMDERGRDSLKVNKGVMLIRDFGRRFATAVLPETDGDQTATDLPS